jgi:hypothetical protein
VHLYPNTAEHTEGFTKVAPALSIPLSGTTNGRSRVIGHQLHLNPSFTKKFVAHPSWTFSLPEEETVQSLVRPLRGPVASLGKVLGNRTTLYKYLNPRLFVVLTASHSIQPPSCGVYLVDAAKGSVVYRATLPAHAGSCDIKVSLSENWLVYHYYDDEVAGTSSAKGFRVVSVELYEGQQTDDKTRRLVVYSGEIRSKTKRPISSELSAFSNSNVDVTAVEQSYVFPYGISAITTTSTKFGITSKDIIGKSNLFS